MKIILASPIYPPEIGGPATYVKELSKRLKDQHELVVVAYTDVGEPFPGTKLIKVSKLNPLPIRLIKYFLALWKASKGADLIYVQNAMAAGIPTSIVCILRRIPYVIRMVGDEAWERADQNKLTKKTWEDFLKAPEGGLKIKLMMIIQGFVFRHASIIAPPSAYNKELIKTYRVDDKKIIVNYTATEETEVLPIEAKPVPHQIVTVARLISLKRIDEIIKALALVKKKYIDAKLIVAGEGPESENLKKLSTELNLENDVIFLGKISRAETWQLRKNSSVYVINSTHESLPISALTSLVAGIPIVATNVSGIREVVYHEKTGLLVEPGDVNNLAQSIERLFEDKGLCDSLVQNGLKMVRDKFSWEAHLKTLNTIFASVLSKPTNVA